MSDLISELMADGWGLALFGILVALVFWAALIALFLWRRRRDRVRRLSKGLRAYTTNTQEVSL